jgi:hypothetical protein
LAAKQPVVIAPRQRKDRESAGTGPIDTGLFVLVQADREKALQPVRRLGTGLRRDGLRAMGVVVFFLTALWGFVIVVLNEPSRSRVFAALRRRAGLKSGAASSSFSSRTGGTAGTGASGFPSGVTGSAAPSAKAPSGGRPAGDADGPSSKPADPQEP